MMTTVPVNPVDAGSSQPARSRSPWIGTGIWVSVTLLLCVTNVLTLLDQDFRSSAYDVVARMTAGPVSQSPGLSRIAKIVHDANPAALEKKAEERVTARMAANSAVLLQEAAVLKREKARLIADRQILRNQLRASQAAVALHKQLIAKLGVRVLARAGRSVTRHLVALPGHALPVLSATVAVGSVVLDLDDACESLKELDSLNQSVGLPGANRSQVCGLSVPTAEDILADARHNWKKVYKTSADALNTGRQIVPLSPPSVSFEAAREWSSVTLGDNIGLV